MASYGNQFLGALRDIFGPTQSTSTLYTVAGGGSATLIATPVSTPAAGRIEVYGISLMASAAAIGTVQLIDATATGIGGTVKWSTGNLPVSFSEDFVRPLYFTKGLVQSYTATAGSLSVNVQWSGVAGA